VDLSGLMWRARKLVSLDLAEEWITPHVPAAAESAEGPYCASRMRALASSTETCAAR
jgi:hypothetical protein